MTIEILTGDMFASGADSLVCPVNCVGVMGAGLALLGCAGTTDRTVFDD